MLARPYNPVFQYDSDEYGTVNWKYREKSRHKMWHQSWLVKKSEITILTKLPPGGAKIVRDEIMVGIELENQQVRDHNNKKARERRARKK